MVDNNNRQFDPMSIRTLVLNSNYLPISIFPLHTIPAPDAVTRIFAGTCKSIFDHSRRIRTKTNFEMYWPSVIVRLDTKMIKERVKLSAESLFYRDHGKCVYCTKPITLQELTCDHVVPKSKGGQFSWNNIVSACPTCNYAKGDKMPVGVWTPKRFPYKPTYYELLNVRKKYPVYVQDESWIPFLGHGWSGGVVVR